MKLASEPVTSAVFVGGKLMFAAAGGVTDLTPLLPGDAAVRHDTGRGRALPPHRLVRAALGACMAMGAAFCGGE